jgi:hypothetical protein
MDKFDDLLKRFGEKNPSFVREIMENHFAKGDYESSQGRITRHKRELHSREDTP